MSAAYPDDELSTETQAFATTLKYIGLTLIHGGDMWLTMAEFATKWSLVAPSDLPVWGVGHANPWHFAHFLSGHGYLGVGYDAANVMYVHTTSDLRDYLAAQCPGEWIAQID